MMSRESVFNNSVMYQLCSYDRPAVSIPARTAFALRAGETLYHTFQPHNELSLDELKANYLDEKDIAIAEELGRSKYLTSLQIYEFLSLRGLRTDRLSLRRRLCRLMEYRVIQEDESRITYTQRGIRVYSLDIKGYWLARERGVIFHRGNQYLTFSQKKEQDITETSEDVKRILCGNQILIEMLKSAKVERFGVMETFCPDSAEERSRDCILRTAVNIKLDNESVLAYEVVRRSQGSYSKMADKVRRYYALLDHAEEYLRGNHHGDCSLPQLVICGEDREHNLEIASYLKKEGLWRDAYPILFTEDLLCFNPLVSLYRIGDGKLTWYGVPEKHGEASRTLTA